MPSWLDFQKALLGLRHSSMGVKSAKQKPARLLPAHALSQLRALLPSKSRFWERKGKARAGGRGQGRNDRNFCGTELFGAFRPLA